MLRNKGKYVFKSDLAETKYVSPNIRISAVTTFKDFKEDGIKSFITTSSHLFLLFILDKWVKIVNSEHPNDFCIIDVSLATPVNQFQSNQQIPRFLQSIIERYPVMRQVIGL